MEVAGPITAATLTDLFQLKPTETEAALRNMVDAARQAREQLVPAG